MRRAKMSRSGQADLPLSASSSSMPRQSELPSRSFSSKLHDDDGKGDSDGGEDEEVDANLEEELLLEIRTLVKKEKYLAHLENQLLEPDDEAADSRSDFSESRSRNGVECEDLYDANDELHQGKRDDDSESDSLEGLAHHRRKLTKRSANSSIRLPRGPRAPSRQEDRQLRSPAPGRAPTRDTPVGQEHFRACFVELNPVQLREIRDLQLPSQGLHLHHLRALSKNLFLFSDLRFVNLADNQLNDSGSKEIREATKPREYSAPQQKTTRTRSKGSGGKTGDSSSAAEQFSRLLAEHLQQRREGGAAGLQSLGLCYAEISRKVVLNAMKMANRLTALDLSFAFIGISGAQVVAAALKMKGYATLTQLNLRCNRTKSMGAKAILAALRVNDRLTALDLSRNEIRSEVGDEVAALLKHNQVLTRLDLSQNEILATNATQISVHRLRDAIAEHRALLSLGLVSSLGGSEGHARMLQDALDKNRIADDQGVLDAINAGMTSTNEGATEDAAAAVKRHVPSAMVLLQAPAHRFMQQPSHRSTFTTVWKHTVSKEARVSLKWKMAVKMAHKSNTGFSEEGGGDHRHRAHSGRTPPLVWKVLVQRKCSVLEVLEDEAATARFPISEGAYELYSAVAYCDTGDTIYLSLGVADDKPNDDDFVSEMGDKQFKVFIKEIVLVPHHLQDRRHMSFSLSQSPTGVAIPWRMKTRLQMTSPTEGEEATPSSFLWLGVVQRVYMHTSGSFRLLARVQFPADYPANNHSTMGEALKTRFWWQLLRSSCWQPHTDRVVLQGAFQDFHGAVRNDHEVVFYLPAMEWMAGEYLQLVAAAINDDVQLHVTQFQLFQQVSALRRGNIAAFSDLDQEGEPAPPFLMPLSVKDEEEEVDNGLTPKARVQNDQTPAHQPDLQQIDKENEVTPSLLENVPNPALLPKRTSESKLTNVSWSLTGIDKLEPISPKKPWLGSPGTNQPSKRRVTVSVDDISPHALDRLGVNADILKKEKGMKKLGICDVDIIRSEELRRYTGISQLAPNSKVEFMFGFNDEQLHRDKAIKRLGTSEQEILDDYSRRVSRLGIPNHVPTGARLQL
ncbi:hypothetical protein BBJ28_00009400 [Nothophytophthora sp. Chile5]|nr:hypothetical protein BBJ28_00009400 [Nothophytophthora sp. Chile5]